MAGKLVIRSDAARALQVLLALLSFVLALGARQAAGMTRYVSASGAQGAACPEPTLTSIQAAVDASMPGDEVRVCSGTYSAFRIPAGSTPLKVMSVSGPASTFVTGTASGCYGIVVGLDGGKAQLPLQNVTIDGFDIFPNATAPTGGSDCAAIITGDQASNVHVHILNNVIHDVLARGTKSCQERYGCVGIALNGVRNALVQNNTIHSLINEGCIPGDVMRPDMSAVQFIFASGARKNEAYLDDPITVRGNRLSNGRGLNSLGIRIKRTTHFIIEDNTIEDLIATDGTAQFPSRSRAIHPMGEDATNPMVGTNIQIRGNVAINTDIGVFLEAVNNVQLTGNDFTRGSAVATVVLANSRGIDACGNLGPVSSDSYITEDVPGGQQSGGNIYPCATASDGDSPCPGQTPSSDACPTVTGSNDVEGGSTDDHSPSFPGWAIALVVVGSVCALLFGVAMFVLAAKKRKEGSSGGQNQSEATRIRGSPRTYGATSNQHQSSSTVSGSDYNDSIGSKDPSSDWVTHSAWSGDDNTVSSLPSSSISRHSAAARDGGRSPSSRTSSRTQTSISEIFPADVPPLSSSRSALSASAAGSVDA